MTQSHYNAQILMFLLIFHMHFMRSEIIGLLCFNNEQNFAVSFTLLSFMGFFQCILYLLKVKKAGKTLYKCSPLLGLNLKHEGKRCNDICSKEFSEFCLKR